MLHKDYVCGYLFDFCEPAVYTQLLTENFATRKLADKPEDVAENDYLDKLYSISNPSLNPPTFRILWLSDMDIDNFYKEGASSVCKDYRCCHANNVLEKPEDAAGKYGNKRCSTSMEGFKKMIETINKLNTTSYMSFTSLIFGGGSNAYIPELLTEATVDTVQAEVFKYIRSLNPTNGLYYALGPHDVYPMNYQDFSTSSNPKLSALDAKLNIENKEAQYSSISGNVQARAEFLQYGYYKVANQFVYNILIDDSSPPK